MKANTQRKSNQISASWRRLKILIQLSHVINKIFFVSPEKILAEAVSSKWKSWPHSRILLLAYIQINAIIMVAAMVKTGRWVKFY